MAIKSYLKAIGLEEKEIKTYITSLELKEASLAQISKKVSLPRSTVQYLLGKLKKRGLLEIVAKDTKHLYIANPPREVLTLLKNKQNKLNEQILKFEESLPELNQIYSTSLFQPRTRFFQGEEIRKIYEEILDSPIDETLFIGSMEKTADAVGKKYLQNWMKRRAQLKIKTKAIRTRSGEMPDPIISASRQGLLRTMRLAPEGFESPSHIIIYGDNVAIITTSNENFGLVITSREYAITMKNIFKEVWKNSK